MLVKRQIWKVLEGLRSVERQPVFVPFKDTNAAFQDALGL